MNLNSILLPRGSRATLEIFFVINYNIFTREYGVNIKNVYNIYSMSCEWPWRPLKNVRKLCNAKNWIFRPPSPLRNNIWMVSCSEKPYSVTKSLTPFPPKVLRNFRTFPYQFSHYWNWPTSTMKFPYQYFNSLSVFQKFPYQYFNSLSVFLLISFQKFPYQYFNSLSVVSWPLSNLQFGCYAIT